MISHGFFLHAPVDAIHADSENEDTDQDVDRLEDKDKERHDDENSMPALAPACRQPTKMQDFENTVNDYAALT